MFKYPYGDSQQLNLDWIIQKIKELEAGGGGGSSDLTLEEVANALISLTYNSGTAYQRDDYCYLQGKLYRALANTSGAFDPASWMEVRIGDDIPVLTRLINAVDTSLSTLQNTVDNLDSDDIENASSQVSGTNVTDALDNLKEALNDYLPLTAGINKKLTGTLGLVNSNLDTTNKPSSATYGSERFVPYSNDGIQLGYYCGALTNDSAGIVMLGRNIVNGNAVTNYIRLLVNDSGQSVVEISDAKPWMSALKAGRVFESTIADIIEASSGFTINTARFYSWGTLAQLAITFTASTAITNDADTVIGTLKTEKRSSIVAGAFARIDTIKYAYIGVNGELHLYGTIPKATTIGVNAIYLLG